MQNFWMQNYLSYNLKTKFIPTRPNGFVETFALYMGLFEKEMN